jgi:hypothetical protein
MILIKFILFLITGMIVCYPFYLIHQKINKRFDRINRQKYVNSLKKHKNYGNKIYTNRKDTFNSSNCS